MIEGLSEFFRKVEGKERKGKEDVRKIKGKGKKKKHVIKLGIGLIYIEATYHVTCVYCK